MYRVRLLIILFVLALIFSGCVFVPVKTNNLPLEQQTGYWPCVSAGGVSVGGKCFGSYTEAIAYWREVNAEYWSDDNRKHQSQYEAGVARARDDLRKRR